MSLNPGHSFSVRLQGLSTQSDNYVPELIRLLLDAARQNRASDIHLVPDATGLQMQWRIDGVLQTTAVFDRDLAPRLIARLKVLCGLLTYRTDIPQEGRVAREHSATEVRVTTFPTLYGEKAAIRLFADSDQLQRLQQLGLVPDLAAAVQDQLDASDGVILLTGPSGSGKTTTAYACLREIVAASQGTRSVMTLEDPVEVAVTGITQSQVRPHVGFDLPTGLKSLMRQDPDVIMVGEIRDPSTAETVFQAALTGHLVLTTFHAGSSVEAITRLLDMGIEPYLLRSALRAVLSQRLLRRLLPPPALVSPISAKPDRLTDKNQQPADQVADTAAAPAPLYAGRLLIAEFLDPQHPELARAVLQRCDARQLAAIAADCGCGTLRQAAQAAVRAGLTTEQEIFRVLGRQ